jgi:hypothetical protein
MRAARRFAEKDRIAGCPQLLGALAMSVARRSTEGVVSLSRTTICLLVVGLALMVPLWGGLGTAFARQAGHVHPLAKGSATCSSAARRGRPRAGGGGERRKSGRRCSKPHKKASRMGNDSPPSAPVLPQPGPSGGAPESGGAASFVQGALSPVGLASESAPASTGGSGSPEGIPGSEPASGSEGATGSSSEGASGSPGGASSTSEPSAPFRLFSPTGPWNEPVPADAALDPSSVAVVGVFNEEIAALKQAGKEPGINTVAYSVPIYTVPTNQPTVKVTLTQTASALQSAWSAVPLPATAKPAAGTDEHLVVWQPSANRLWEFWRLVHGTGGWHASWGGAMQNVSSNPGVYGLEAWPGATPWWGASASSLSIAGGLMTLEDFKLGQINHALALGIPHVRIGIYASPAKRTDGKFTEPLSLPEGAHLRLDPNLNLAALKLPPVTLKIAEAAQRYGIFIRDTAGNVCFYAQDPIPTGTEPYTGPYGYFEGKSAGQLMASFPWSHLQLLKMQLT